ncbi:MAG: 2-iminoacetate synthase ThiH [Bacteroidetes bacterium]|nr:2-iminoacetate synthase ThiH [Bacteroidota bacterium]
MFIFSEILKKHDWIEIRDSIQSKTASDVEAALYKHTPRSLGDFQALISPAAAPYLEEMAQMSSAAAKKRFGKTIQMYIPLYLSNECQNICTYCGFSYHNKIKRITLKDEEIVREAEAIKKMGFEHVLLVTGEAGKKVSMPYFKHALSLIRPFFSNISMEVQPLEEEEYAELIRLGLHSVFIYQETYNRESYSKYHPKGKKSNFDYRLITPDRLGRAGIFKIGLGVLLGLEEWRTDSFFCALHLKYLQKNYWQTKYSVSFPRLRPAAGIQLGSFFENGNGTSHFITDRELVQLICAYRLLDPDIELSVSTRESRNFRDHIVKLGVTSISAGSRTNPGGYSLYHESLEQFEINDDRTPSEVASMLEKQGYQAVWKDWDRNL